MKYYKWKGSGLVNSLINKLPIELHIPGYKFCGPGTKLTERLARGDRGINILDESCREHDIAYANEKDLKERHKADKVLASAAVQRFKSSSTPLGERLAALGVAGIMKVKVRLGMGLNKQQQLHSQRKINKSLNLLNRTKILFNLIEHNSFEFNNLKMKKQMKNYFVKNDFQNVLKILKKIKQLSNSMDVCLRSKISQ